jgi:hypothetical protein
MGKRLINLIAMSWIFSAFAFAHTYTVKVLDTGSSEERTFDVLNFNKEYSIPLPFSKYSCQLAESKIWKKKDGGLSIECARPGAGFSAFVNCTDRNYASLQLMVPVKELVYHLKDRNLPVDKEQEAKIDSDLLVNGISIRVVCDGTFK